MASEVTPARVGGDEQVGVSADDGSGGPVVAGTPSHRFDVELLCEVDGVDGKSRHWLVVAEAVPADYGEQAVELALSNGETWKASPFGTEYRLAGDDTAEGRYRTVDRSSGWMNEFDVEVRRIVVARRAEP